MFVPTQPADTFVGSGLANNDTRLPALAPNGDACRVTDVASQTVGTQMFWESRGRRDHGAGLSTLAACRTALLGEQIAVPSDGAYTVTATLTCDTLLHTIDTARSPRWDGSQLLVMRGSLQMNVSHSGGTTTTRVRQLALQFSDPDVAGRATPAATGAALPPGTAVTLTATTPRLRAGELITVTVGTITEHDATFDDTSMTFHTVNRWTVARVRARLVPPSLVVSCVGYPLVDGPQEITIRAFDSGTHAEVDASVTINGTRRGGMVANRPFRWDLRPAEVRVVERQGVIVSTHETYPRATVSADGYPPVTCALTIDT